MVGRAVKAEIDAEWNRSPCWVVLSTVEADLETVLLNASTCLTGGAEATLLAGLVFSFSKILRDSCLDAKAIMNHRQAVVCVYKMGGGVWNDRDMNVGRRKCQRRYVIDTCPEIDYVVHWGAGSHAALRMHGHSAAITVE